MITSNRSVYNLGTDNSLKTDTLGKMGLAEHSEDKVALKDVFFHMYVMFSLPFIIILKHICSD